LFGGVWHLGAPRVGDELKRLIGVVPTTLQDTGSDHRRPSDTNAAVNRYGVAIGQAGGQAESKVARCPQRRRNTAIRDGKRDELDSICMAQRDFLLEVEFSNLMGFQQADDDIDALGSPTGNLILKPLTRTWAWHDREAHFVADIDPADGLFHSIRLKK
jgi:hypothetical protein